MINKISSKLNILTGLLLSILFLIAVILFFPVKIDHNYTCIFHKEFNAHHIINAKDDLVTDSSKRLNARNSSGNESVARSQLLLLYLKEYAMLWWSSLIILVLIISYLKKTIIKQKAIAKEK